jgi:hypothetical protein
VSFRKAYLQLLIDVVEVDDTQIRIKGSKDVLERAVLAGGNDSGGGSQMSTRWRSLGKCVKLAKSKTYAKVWVENAPLNFKAFQERVPNLWLERRRL